MVGARGGGSSYSRQLRRQRWVLPRQPKLLHTFGAPSTNASLVGVTATQVIASPTGAVLLTSNVALTGTVATVNPMSPAGVIAVQTNVGISGVVTTDTLFSPPGATTVTTSITVQGVVSVLALAASAGTGYGDAYSGPYGTTGVGSVSTTSNIAVIGGVSSLSLLTLAGVVSVTTNVSLSGAVSSVSLVPPAGTVTLAAGTGTTYLRGVNSSGADFGNRSTGGGVYDSDASFAFYAARRHKLIRLPFLWERIQPTLSGALDTGESGRLQAAVNSATSRGMTVVLDVHNYARYQTADSVTHVIGDGYLTNAHLADLWTRLSTVFKGNTLVRYGLMNEPHDMPSSPGAFASGKTLFDFETTSSGWGGDGCTVARSTVAFHDGVASLAVTASALTNAASQNFDANDSNNNTIVATDGATLAVWVLVPSGTTGTNWKAKILFQDASYSYQIGPAINLTPGTWAQITWTPPAALIANHKAFAVQFTVDNPTTATALVYVDTAQQGAVSGGATQSQTWEQAAQAAVTAIRNNGDTNYIHVPGVGYSSAAYFWTNHPTWWINDPANKSGPEGHYYFDSDNSGAFNNTYAYDNTAATNQGYASITDKTQKQLTSFVNGCNSRNLHGFLGEMGWPNAGVDSASYNAVGDAAYTVLDGGKQDVVYWAAGEQWGTTYKLSAYTGTPQSAPTGVTPIIEAHQSSVQAVPTVSLAGVPSGFLLSALAGVVTAQTNAVVSGMSANNMLSAPAGTVSVTASVAMSSAPTSLAYVASAGAVNAIQSVALAGAVSALTVAAPSGIAFTVTNVSLSGVVQGVVFAAPAGMVGTGSFSTNAAPIGVSASLSFLALSGVVTNGINTALSGSPARLFLVAPAGAVIPAVQINGASASVTLGSPAGTVAMAVNATPLGVPAVTTSAAPAGGVNVTSPANLSGATSPLALLSAAGGVVGTSVTAGVVSALSLTTLPGSVLGTSVLTGQTVALLLNAPAGSVTTPSAAGSVSLTGSPILLALAVPAGSSSLSVTLTGALSTLSTSPPVGSVTASSAATSTSQTATPSPLTVSSVPGSINPVSVVINAVLSGPSTSLTLGTPAGSFIQTVVIPGSTATFALTSPAGVAAMNVNPAGVTAGLSYSALAGVLLLHTNATPLGSDTFFTMAAPPGLVTISVATTNINLSGLTTTSTITATAGAVTPSVMVNGISSTAALSAPAGVMSLSVVIPGPTAVLLHTAPAGFVTPVSTANNFTLFGAPAFLVLSAPVGVSSAATNVLISVSAASLSMLTPVGAPALVTNAAILGAPATMTMFAPAGTLSSAVVMYGAPASLAFTGSPGTAAMSVNVLGTTTSFALQAVSGLVPEHSYIVIGTTALMKAYSPPGGVALFIGVPQQMKGAVRSAGRWTPRVPPTRTRST